MCGIVAYSGRREAQNLIFDCLKRLEYRGYDSAGVALLSRAGKIIISKDQGSIAHLKGIMHPVSSNAGIGHTRWATCGRPTKNNAHPFFDCKMRIALAHNGIIENHFALRLELMKRGHVFTSETDTEVVVHLIEETYDGDPLSSVRKTISRLKGSYAFAILFENGEIIGARKDNPLILGIGKDEGFLASDIPAILPYTNKVVYISDGELVSIKNGKPHWYDHEGKEKPLKIEVVPWGISDAEKGGYAHYMLKEIYEQPQAIRDSLIGREDIFEEAWYFRRCRYIRIIGCGTSYHAALAGKTIIERRLGIPVIPEIASEYRYSPEIKDDSLDVFISQSGETADTVAASRIAKKVGHETIAICNVLGSSLTREVKKTVYTQAGPEISVAATKTFVTQILALHLLSMKLGQMFNLLSPDEIRKIMNQLRTLPRLAEVVLSTTEGTETIAEKISKSEHAFFIGRGGSYPIALEGALKLKEISYIHAEGYPAGELKHGPLALITEGVPVIALVFRDETYEKMLANMDEIIARGADITAVCIEGDPEVRNRTDNILSIPEPPDPIYSQILASITLQLLAYHCARIRGCEIDYPRNLAKSVTVE